jgi:putative SOS response-associated peptidase YedK
MCGRYVTPDEAAIEREWNLHGRSSPQRIGQVQQSPFGNPDASPTQRVPLLRVIRDSGGHKELVEARWGLIPNWAKGEPPKYSTFNAKMETLTTTASYRGPWDRSQRCLIPVRGFYEWQAQPPDWQKTVRHYITLNDQDLFCFAGLWEKSIKADGTMVESVTIITLPANELMRMIHNSRKRGAKRELLPESERRMPAILRKEDQETWLSGTPEQAWPLLRPYPSEYMVARPVNGPVDPAKDLFHQ